MDNRQWIAEARESLRELDAASVHGSGLLPGYRQYRHYMQLPTVVLPSRKMHSVKMPLVKRISLSGEPLS